MSERDEILNINIPRLLWCQVINRGSFELYPFCDASMKAFGCAIYLISKTKSGISQCTLKIFNCFPYLFEKNQFLLFFFASGRPEFLLNNGIIRLESSSQ